MSAILKSKKIVVLLAILATLVLTAYGGGGDSKEAPQSEQAFAATSSSSASNTALQVHWSPETVDAVVSSLQTSDASSSEQASQVFGEPTNRRASGAKAPDASPIQIPSSSKETYASAIALAIPWGSQLGQVGLFEPKQLDAGDTQVPQSFDVDRQGNVLILDSVNGRVVRFDATGKFVGAFPVAATDDIRVASDGSVYVLGYGIQEVLHYGSAGNLIARHAIPKSIEQPYLGLYFDTSGRLLLAHRDRQSKSSGGLAKRYSALSAQDNAYRSYAGMPSEDPDAYYAYSGTADPLMSLIRIYDRNNVLQRSMTLTFPSFPAKGRPYVYFIGVDQGGNLYFRSAFESAKHDGWEDVILKYSSKGELVASMPISDQIIRDGVVPKELGTMFVRSRVGSGGDVYFAFPLQTSFVVVRSFR